MFNKDKMDCNGIYEARKGTLPLTWFIIEWIWIYRRIDQAPPKCTKSK